MGNRKDYNIQDARCPEFTQRFREYINKHGGVNQFCKETQEYGFQPATVNHWYNGTRSPEGVALQKLSKATGLSVDYLLGLSNTPSVSADAQAACKYLRLPPNAIERIHKETNRMFATRIEFLSKIIQSDRFWKFAWLVFAGSVSVEEAKEYLNTHLMPQTNLIDKLLEYDADCHDIENDVIASKYRFTEIAQSLYDEMVNYQEIIKAFDNLHDSIMDKITLIDYEDLREEVEEYYGNNEVDGN